MSRSALFAIFALVWAPATRAATRCFHPSVSQALHRLHLRRAGPLPEARTLASTAPSARAAPLSADILDRLSELPRAEDRAKFRELITAARRQIPPLRGIDAYERVIFQSVLHQGDHAAILDTLIPTRHRDGENSVRDMITYLENHPPCNRQSICGDLGQATFQRTLSQIAPDFRPDFPRIQELGRNAAAEQARLLARLRQIDQAGAIRYEDWIRLGVEFSRLNFFSTDMRLFPHRVDELSRVIRLSAKNWQRQLEVRFDPSALSVEYGREQANRLLDPRILNRAVASISMKPYGEMEIAHPGFMTTPLEMAPGFSVADANLETSLSNVRHDGNHRSDMAGSSGAPGDLNDLDSQLFRLRRWEPVERLMAELEERNPSLLPAVRVAIFKWHEFVDDVDLAELCLIDEADVQPLGRYLLGSPRWAREAEAEFYVSLSRVPDLRHRVLVGMNGSPEAWAEIRDMITGHYFATLLGRHDSENRWRRLLALSRNAALMRQLSPLKQRMVRAFVEAYR